MKHIVMGTHKGSTSWNWAWLHPCVGYMDTYGASRCLYILVSVYIFQAEYLDDAYTCRGSNGADKRISHSLYSPRFLGFPGALTFWPHYKNSF